MPNLNVLGLDLSATRTGWAAWHEGQLKAGAKPLKGPKDPRFESEHFVAFHEWLCSVLDAYGPSLVIYEEGNFATKSQATMRIHFGLYTLIKTECCRRGIQVAQVSPKSLKEFVTGKGNASKDEMKSVAKERFADYDAEGDVGGDEGDARHLVCFGIEQVLTGLAPTTARRKKPRRAKKRPAQTEQSPQARAA